MPLNEEKLKKLKELLYKDRPDLREPGIYDPETWEAFKKGEIKDVQENTE